MILGDLARILLEELNADCPTPGDTGRTVRGLAVDEPVKGWLGPEEVAVTDRASLDGEFLEQLSEGGSPALIWRTENGAPPEVSGRVAELGLGLFVLAPEVPFRRLLSIFADDSGLLLYSHRTGRELLHRAGEKGSLESVAQRTSELLGCHIVVEDPVGRLLAGGAELREMLDRHGARASRPSVVDETRRERRDRYARLPDGFLSVPVERWRVGGDELFWTPVSGAPAGYLWMDLRGRPLGPEDVVALYWARQVLETELGKEQVRLETELGLRGDFVEDVIHDRHGSVEQLLQRAGYLGADLSAGALAVIVDIDGFARYLERRRLEEPAIQDLKRRLADAVRLQAGQMFSNFLTGARSDNVILLVGSAEGEPPGELPELALRLADRVQRYVRGLLTDLTVSIGIGRYAGPDTLSDAHSEAAVALEIGQRVHGPSSVSTFEGAGTYKLLFRVLQEDPEELESFYRETIAPVVAYDSRYGTELVHTLTAYLDNDASTVRTATELFAHRHTIRYRLDRTGELTGLDVDKSEDRERLTLGIKAMQLLGRLPTEPSRFMDR